MAKYCVNCGQVMPIESAPFCPNCGSPQTANAANPQRVIAQPVEEMFTCPRCGGRGKFGFGRTCPVCFGNGQVSERKVEQFRKTQNSQAWQSIAAIIFMFFFCAFLYWLLIQWH